MQFVLGSRYALATSLNWGVAVVNGFAGHLVPLVLDREYNRGAFQSFFMVPIGAYVLPSPANHGSLTCLKAGAYLLCSAGICFSSWIVDEPSLKAGSDSFDGTAAFEGHL